MSKKPQVCIVSGDGQVIVPALPVSDVVSDAFATQVSLLLACHRPNLRLGSDLTLCCSASDTLVTVSADVAPRDAIARLRRIDGVVVEDYCPDDPWHNVTIAGSPHVTMNVIQQALAVVAPAVLARLAGRPLVFKNPKPNMYVL